MASCCQVLTWLSAKPEGFDSYQFLLCSCPPVTLFPLTPRGKSQVHSKIRTQPLGDGTKLQRKIKGEHAALLKWAPVNTSTETATLHLASSEQQQGATMQAPRLVLQSINSYFYFSCTSDARLYPLWAKRCLSAVQSRPQHLSINKTCVFNN